MATTKRVRDPEAKRKAILKSALYEFATHSYGGSRAENIASGAGVSVGMIYRIFSSKEGLANAVYRDCMEKISTKINGGITQSKSFKEAFENMWDSYSELFFKDPDCLIFFEHHLHDDFLDKANREARKKLRENLRLWIVSAQKNGVMVDFPSKLLRALTIGGIMRLIREARDGNAKLTRKDLNQLRDFVWKTISVE